MKRSRFYFQSYHGENHVNLFQHHQCRCLVLYFYNLRSCAKLGSAYDSLRQRAGNARECGRGGTFFNDVWALRNLSTPTMVENHTGSEGPATFRLLGNYPNPFVKSSAPNSATTIIFELPEARELSLQIYNVQGQLIRNLFEGKLEAGRHQMKWDGANDQGARTATGNYFYVLKAGTLSVSRKLVLVE